MDSKELGVVEGVDEVMWFQSLECALGTNQFMIRINLRDNSCFKTCPILSLLAVKAAFLWVWVVKSLFYINSPSKCKNKVSVKHNFVHLFWHNHSMKAKNFQRLSREKSGKYKYVRNWIYWLDWDWIVKWWMTGKTRGRHMVVITSMLKMECVLKNYFLSTLHSVARITNKNEAFKVKDHSELIGHSSFN